MKRYLTATLCCIATICLTSVVHAQGPMPATQEHKILKMDVGSWNAKGKMWMPGSSEPMEFSGEENNTMVGELWVITDFKGDFGGMPFHGHGRSGYNPDSKKYEGSWFDSMTPYASSISGSYDESTKTMTSIMKGKDETGNDTTTKSTIVYKDENTRVMTMWMADPENKDNMVKGMEIIYTRKKKN